VPNSPDYISRRKYCVERALEFTKDVRSINAIDVVAIAKTIEEYIWGVNENRN